MTASTRTRFAIACGVVSAGVLNGLNDDSRTAAHAALSQLAGSADCADEEQDQHVADGSR